MSRTWGDWRLWIVIAYFGIGGVSVGIVWASHDSRAADQRYARSNREAIVQACEERDRIRTAVALVLTEAIAARQKTGLANDLELARRYQEILKHHLQPVSCRVERRK